MLTGGERSEIGDIGNHKKINANENKFPMIPICYKHFDQSQECL